MVQGVGILVVILTQVGNVARNRIAHILSDGSVDLNWNPNADGGVSTLAINGSAIYVGSEFDSIGGQICPSFDQFNSTGIIISPTSTSKYQHLKEKLQQHLLKNELKDFRFKKVLK
jgi:hypothetical protein